MSFHIPGWTTLSDGRFKVGVEENVPGLAFINALRPVSYQIDVQRIDDFVTTNYGAYPFESPRNTGKLKKRSSGFSAQEVEAAAKKLEFSFHGVDRPSHNGDYYGLRYAEFVVPLVQAVQELSDQNAVQQEMIAELRQEIEDLKKNR